MNGHESNYGLGCGIILDVIIKINNKINGCKREHGGHDSMKGEDKRGSMGGLSSPYIL